MMRARSLFPCDHRPLRRLRLAALLLALTGPVGCSIDQLLGGRGEDSPPEEPPLPQRLAFTQQPAGATVANPISPPIQVAVFDQFGSVLRTFAGPLTLTMAVNAGDGELRGPLTRPVVDGVATFAGVSITREGRGYQLAVHGADLDSAMSQPFDIRALPGPAALTVEMGAGQTDTVGATLSQPYVVRVADVAGDPVAGVTVHWSVSAGNGSVSQAMTSTDASGRALTLHTLGTTAGEQRVTATVPGPAGLIATFTPMATHATPSSLIFVQQPTNAPPGGRITPPVRLTVQDRFGNRATSMSATITLSLVPLSGTPLATLSGTRSRNFAQGAAEFTDLSIDLPGVGYRLRAIAGTLQADSGPFNIS